MNHKPEDVYIIYKQEGFVPPNTTIPAGTVGKCIGLEDSIFLHIEVPLPSGEKIVTKMDARSIEGNVLVGRHKKTEVYPDLEGALNRAEKYPNVVIKRIHKRYEGKWRVSCLDNRHELTPMDDGLRSEVEITGEGVFFVHSDLAVALTECLDNADQVAIANDMHKFE